MPIMATEFTQTMPQESVPQTVVTASADAGAGARILYVDRVGWYCRSTRGIVIAFGGRVLSNEVCPGSNKS